MPLLYTRAMKPRFTAHNIRLDDGSFTRSEGEPTIADHPWLRAAKRVIHNVFPEARRGLRLADLGTLEGGYAVEFARMGLDVVGLEVRSSNFAACEYVRDRVDLPNLSFVLDDVWNVAKYGRFDVTFCCGLLYHLDRPRAMLKTLAEITDRVLILQTHFAPSHTAAVDRVPRRFRRMITRRTGDIGTGVGKFTLSRRVQNEGLYGRWFREFRDDAQFARREDRRWSSWSNRRSFWIERPDLLQTLHALGFDLVLEQFDTLGDDLAASMRSGYYRTASRGTFVGIKSPLPMTG